MVKVELVPFIRCAENKFIAKLTVENNKTFYFTKHFAGIVIVTVTRGR